MATHVHDFHELGRVFPFDEEAQTIERLSPDGIHDPETGELVLPGKAKGKLRELYESKVPKPRPVIILQCQDESCPEGPKHVQQVELTKPEWEKIRRAFEEGKLDPDGNGTNRYVSTLSLTDLGLARIDKMLGDGRTSGARDTIQL